MTKQEQTKGYCCATVWQGMSRYSCSKVARFEFEGRPFCKVHYPPTLRAKDKARHLKWEAERVAENRIADEVKAKQAALELDAARWRYWRVYMPSTMSEHELDSMVDEGLRRIAMEDAA